MSIFVPWLKSAALRGAVVVLSCLALAVHAGSQTLTTIDDPSAATSGGYGTGPTGINVWGAVTGVMGDSSGRLRGFVRSPNGHFQDFDAPAADPYLGCTCPVAINDFGTIAGWAMDQYFVTHGFLRYPNGLTMTVDFPHAVNGTMIEALNDFGIVTGNWVDAQEITHGFVRGLDGRFVSFDAPATGVDGSSGQGTFPLSINIFGVVAGYYRDSSGLNHGFIRSPQGGFSTFDVPDAIGDLMNSAFINDRGIIAGTWISEHSDACTCDIEAGYQRSANGAVVPYQGPYGPLQNVEVYGLNVEGAAVGWYGDTNDYAHAFVRSANGALTNIDFTGQLESFASAINDRGMVTGVWTDADGGYHGFLWSPKTEIFATGLR